MKAKPIMSFAVRDWLTDPAVSRCAPATRGIWFDALCLMHQAGRTGQLAGTLPELARSLRCSEAELAAALAELAATNTAEITPCNAGCNAGCNALVTLTNRRMLRDYKRRNCTLLRVKSHRTVTPMKRSSNAKSNAAGNAATDDPNLLPLTPRPPRSTWNPPPAPPDLPTVLAWAQMIGCPPPEAEKFWHHFESTGWLDRNGNPVMNARAKLVVWSADLRARPPAPSASAPAVSPAELILRQKELERVESAIAKIRSSYDSHQTMSAADRAKLAPLKTRRAELMRLLGLSA